MSNTSDWFQYFPGDAPENYRWSSAFSLALGLERGGGSTLSELHRAGRALSDQVGDDTAWFNQFSALGERTRDQANQLRTANPARTITASDLSLRACIYFQLAERFLLPKSSESTAAYKESLESFAQFATSSVENRLIRVDITSEVGTLPAWYIAPREGTHQPSSAVVFFGGLDITKEIQFCMAARELSRRGIACLVVDGPGTGEALRHNAVTLRHDYEVAGSAAYEYLAGRGDIDPNRIGVIAVSLGGYYAPRCAAMDPRFAACVAWGAIWDYHLLWLRRIEHAYNTSLSIPGDHICWVLGVDTTDQALDALRDFTLEGIVQEIRCPFLVVHGTNDAQVPLSDAHTLYERAGSEVKELRLFDAEEGGAQHSQIDYLPAAAAYISDWLREHL